jgi:hypothetical protein
MESLAKTISSLEAHRDSLVSELGTIDARLTAISKVLGTPTPAIQTRRPNANNGAADSAGSKAPSTKRPRRSWFARDEAAKLLRRAAKKPRPAADLVREVAALKGYAGHLSTDDMRRFQGAAFMAIEQAVKNGALKRRTSGELLAA